MCVISYTDTQMSHHYVLHNSYKIKWTKWSQESRIGKIRYDKMCVLLQCHTNNNDYGISQDASYIYIYVLYRILIINNHYSSIKTMTYFAT